MFFKIINFVVGKNLRIIYVLVIWVWMFRVVDCVVKICYFFDGKFCVIGFKICCFKRGLVLVDLFWVKCRKNVEFGNM